MRKHTGCTICLHEYNEGDRLRKLQCDHAFHKDCLDEWFREEKKCPNCNLEIV